MAAINFQYEDEAMDFERALFRDNEGLGYILKPAFLCNRASSSEAGVFSTYLSFQLLGIN